MNAGLVIGADGVPRCAWAGQSPDYTAYHDHEWGQVVRGESALYERLTLEAFQSGLAWITILRKREAFRAAFDGFDPEKVAKYGEVDRARLMADAGIVRSNAKIDAAIGSAKIYLSMRDAGEDFSEFCWRFVDGKPVQNHWTARGQVPAATPLAEEVSKALKAKGFKFVGPVIVYAWMQAVGIINDHMTCCHRHEAVKRMAR